MWLDISTCLGLVGLFITVAKIGQTDIPVASVQVCNLCYSDLDVLCMDVCLILICLFLKILLHIFKVFGGSYLYPDIKNMWLWMLLGR